MNPHPCNLAGIAGERVALCDVHIEARLDDLLAEARIRQTYRNDEAVPIEAVYTFALPLDAVLLALEVRIGERVLRGTVVERRKAEARYEQALDDGDAAVLLQQPEPGLYTMNVGNLLPGEAVDIRFDYALLHRWSGDRLRFLLPTTVAPRYGVSPLAPHQTPEAALDVELPFSLRLELLGALRDARCHSPTHPLVAADATDRLVLTLQRSRAPMDRDFVLEIHAPEMPHSVVACGQDGTGVRAVARMQPRFPGLQTRRDLALVVVVDCSGSMAGDSIAQAREALLAMLTQLQPRDQLELIAFGSRTRALASGLHPCTPEHLARARAFVQALDADLGGTEIAAALARAHQTLGTTASADIFLITDGEVGDWQAVVQGATVPGRRIFTVGVGSAVAEAFVRGLAAQTGGACELVSPNEAMAGRMLRHFERLRAARARSAHLRWPEGAEQADPPRLDAIFDGDTVLASAYFATQPTPGAQAVLEIETEQGAVLRQELPLVAGAPSTGAQAVGTQDPSTVARLAVAARLRADAAPADAAAATALALRYQLISPWTHWLLVVERAEAERATQLPELRKVPQMLAAGWGGAGTVRSLAQDTSIAFCAAEDASDFEAMLEGTYPIDGGIMPLMMATEVPASEPAPIADPSVLPMPLRHLLRLVESDPTRIGVDGALGLLQEAGLTQALPELIRQGLALGLGERMIAAAVLVRLLDALAGHLNASATTHLGMLDLEVTIALALATPPSARAVDRAKSASGQGTSALVAPVADALDLSRPMDQLVVDIARAVSELLRADALVVPPA
ncbi:MAG: VIT and VWA domain-containing protein [Rhodoferax sp.]